MSVVPFAYDVFLSYSSKDQAVVRELAERLKKDGLRVWFDDWEIRAGDNIPFKLEQGLESSRFLLLCMSDNAFGSDWAALESQTFRFRDPLNKERRFIPLRLDEAQPKGALAQFSYVDWRASARERHYPRLLEACRLTPVARRVESEERPPEAPWHTQSILAVAFSITGRMAISGAADNNLCTWDVKQGIYLDTLRGHSGRVRGVAFSPRSIHALSCSNDCTVRLWDLNDGACQRVFQGHTDRVYSIAWSPDGRFALSGSGDSTMRLWDVRTGECLRVFNESMGGVRSVLWIKSSTGTYGRALSGSSDNLVRLWDLDGHKSLRALKGHTRRVCCLAWIHGWRHALSGSADGTLRMWDVDSGRCLRVFEGHLGVVNSVVVSHDGKWAVTGSSDRTLRQWDIDSGRCIRVLEGHTAAVLAVALSPGGALVLSGSGDSTLRLWDMERSRCLRVFNGQGRALPLVDTLQATAGAEDVRAQVLRALAEPQDALQASLVDLPEDTETGALQYTNAKVLLVGESGSGKTGLSMRLARDTWKESDSTSGAWATQWKLPLAASDGVDREIWLWDFGGQADQRLIHQLYMNETALAILVFDPQREDTFDKLGQWDRDLSRAARRPFKKILVAGRLDVGGLRVNRSQIEAFAKERGYAQYIETSAKTGAGCVTLKEAIINGIQWENIPWRSSPKLFKRLKEEIIRLKDEGRVLLRLNELREMLQLKLAAQGEHFNDEDLKAVVGLLAGPGVVWELSFGSWVLLQPERVNTYAQAVIRTMRGDERQLGRLREESVLRGELDYSAMSRLPEDEERIVLLAMHQALVERGLCLRIHDPDGKTPTLLVFPSYYGRERPDLVGHPAVYASYRFTGFLDDIYATLVVRLHHAEPFEHAELWRYAADFKTALGKRLGIKLTRRAEGVGELEVYFDPSVSVDDKVVFSKYVHEHLLAKAQDVERLRHYVCPRCATPVENRSTAMKRLTRGKKDILCVECEERMPLWDELEERFASPEVQERVHKLQEQAKLVLDAQSKERALVGDVISTVSLAGQISREFSVSDHGIDMEIEFKSDSGEATGRKLYLQLKSGDSHLRRRERDGAEIFAIREERHAQYWMDQAFPVLLVIRNSAGEVRWMEVRDWLKRETENGQKTVKQIVFEGERFDVMSVRRWRDRALDSGIIPALE